MPSHKTALHTAAALPADLLSRSLALARRLRLPPVHQVPSSRSPQMQMLHREPPPLQARQDHEAATPSPSDHATAPLVQRRALTSRNILRRHHRLRETRPPPPPPFELRPGAPPGGGEGREGGRRSGRRLDLGFDLLLAGAGRDEGFPCPQEVSRLCLSRLLHTHNNTAIFLFLYI